VPTLAQQAPCQLNTDFSSIVAKLGPTTVGDCVSDELVGAPGGDRFQSTTRGLLILSGGGDRAAVSCGPTAGGNKPGGLASSGGAPAPVVQPAAPSPAQPAQPTTSRPAA